MQGVDCHCLEELAFFSPIFTTWWPYTQFFDSLVLLLPQKKELPKGVIIHFRKMINKVKELNGFFLEKL